MSSKKSIRHEIQIPQGKIVVREEINGEDTGPFASFCSDETSKRLGLAEKMALEANKTFMARAKKVEEHKEEHKGE